VNERAGVRETRREESHSVTAQPADSVVIAEFPNRQPRLVLARRDTGRGRLDGGWWPRSRDARAQLPALVAGLNARSGVVLRLAVDVLAWDEIPRRIAVDGHVVRVGWFTDTHHVIVVTLGHREHLLLLVVPPLAPQKAARAALALSVQPPGLGAQQTLERCGIETEPVARLSARPIAAAA
jgi:uncharacterized protein DUF5994